MTKNWKRSAFLLTFLVLISLLFIVGCRDEPALVERPYTTIEGQVFGTYYRITYQDSIGQDFQEPIEGLLQEIDDEVSTYNPNSTISQFNQSETVLPISVDSTIKSVNRTDNGHFAFNMAFAQLINQLTNGAFDPTVMPLVNYWGFGYTGKEPVTKVDSAKVDSLMAFVGMDKVQLGSSSIRKSLPGVQIDLSASAKGYAVDQIGAFFQSKGIVDYFIDIGGDGIAKGVNSRGLPWKIAIRVPQTDVPRNAFQAVVPLKDKALTTSGNYENYYEVDGNKYGHTINPTTGFPEKNNLLSASVFHEQCMVADGFSTAFMVLGYPEAYELAERMDDIEAYFIYGDEAGAMQVKYTSGLKEIFENYD